MNCKTIRCCFILLAMALSSRLIVCDGGSERMFKHFCDDIGIDSSPSELNVDGDEYFCECEMIASPLVGKPTIKIDCTFNDRIANLTNKFFGAENLPPNTASLVLSFQLFTELPQLIGDLKHLDMSNNRIGIVKDSDFLHVKTLEGLHLNDNEIKVIEARAFAPLTRLRHLDLSTNQLVVVPANVFAPLIRLDTLLLSGNEGFGRLKGKNATNSSLTLLYPQLGVTRNLIHLEIARCNLTSINLAHGDGLEFLNLGE
jgi:Leucine-rich repeat (LRR) protein